MQLLAIAKDGSVPGYSGERTAALTDVQTVPERNASHRVLENLGFEPAGAVEHPEDGTVLEWRLMRRASA